MFPAKTFSQNETVSSTVSHEVLKSSGGHFPTLARNIAGAVCMALGTIQTSNASTIIPNVSTSCSLDNSSHKSECGDSSPEWIDNDPIILFVQSEHKGDQAKASAQWSISVPQGMVSRGGTLTLLYDVEIGTASRGSCTTGSAPIWGASQGFSKKDFDMKAILQYSTQNNNEHDDHGNGNGNGNGHDDHGNGNGNGHDGENMTTIAIITTPVHHNDNQAAITCAEALFMNQDNNSATLSFAPGSEEINFGLDFSVSNCGGAVRLSNVRYIFTPTPHVPEPGTLMLGAVGTFLFTYRRKRMSKKTLPNI